VTFGIDAETFHLQVYYTKPYAIRPRGSFLPRSRRAGNRAEHVQQWWNDDLF